jgi:Fe-Mn family superoxide dismutase
VSRWPAAVRNNAGGHWNHTFFWTNLAPPGRGGTPDAALLARVQRDFGSLEAMQRAFDAAAVARFGSGWAWLVVRDDGSLAVTSTPNQDNPLMDVAEVRGVPILGLDVWEHAYYLRYRNRRAEYATAWWNVVNWNDVNRRYAAATSGRGAAP